MTEPPESQPPRPPDPPERPEPPFPPDPEAPRPEPPPDPAAEAEAYDPASETGRVFDAPPRGPAAEGDRALASLCHLSGLAWMLGAFVLGPLVPLAIWYLARREDRLVERHAKEACNFQINMVIWGAVAVLLTLTCVLSVVGIPLALAVLVLSVVMPVVAAIRTSSGEDYRYPLIYRFFE